MRNRRCRKMKRNVVDACEPLPNRFAYIMARGCRNLGRYAFLCGGEPFCHQTGPYQTLRAETWWSQLLVRFCVFFDFKKSWNHQNEGQNFRDVLFLEKKRPLPGMHHTEVRSGDGHQNPNIQISRYPDIQMSRYPDIQISRCPDVQVSRYPDVQISRCPHGPILALCWPCVDLAVSGGEGGPRQRSEILPKLEQKQAIPIGTKTWPIQKQALSHHCHIKTSNKIFVVVSVCCRSALVIHLLG